MYSLLCVGERERRGRCFLLHLDVPTTVYPNKVSCQILGGLFFFVYTFRNSVFETFFGLFLKNDLIFLFIVLRCSCYVYMSFAYSGFVSTYHGTLTERSIVRVCKTLVRVLQTYSDI